MTIPFSWPFCHIYLDGLVGRVEYVQLLNDVSEVGVLEINSDQRAQNTQIGGTPSTLTLELLVAVSVIELFLKISRA